MSWRHHDGFGRVKGFGFGSLERIISNHIAGEGANINYGIFHNGIFIISTRSPAWVGLVGSS